MPFATGTNRQLCMKHTDFTVLESRCRVLLAHFSAIVDFLLLVTHTLHLGNADQYLCEWWEQMSSTVNKYKRLEQLVALGDCNARTGGMEGPHCGGYGAENPNRKCSLTLHAYGTYGFRPPLKVATGGIMPHGPRRMETLIPDWTTSS